jgi:hypothetical protein
VSLVVALVATALLVTAVFLVRWWRVRTRRRRLFRALRAELAAYTVPRAPLYVVVAGNYAQGAFHARELAARYDRRDVVYVDRREQLVGLRGNGRTRVLLLGTWWESPLLTGSDRDLNTWELRRIDPELDLR